MCREYILRTVCLAFFFYYSDPIKLVILQVCPLQKTKNHISCMSWFQWRQCRLNRVTTGNGVYCNIHTDNHILALFSWLLRNTSYFTSHNHPKWFSVISLVSGHELNWILLNMIPHWYMSECSKTLPQHTTGNICSDKVLVLSLTIWKRNVWTFNL